MIEPECEHFLCVTSGKLTVAASTRKRKNQYALNSWGILATFKICMVQQKNAWLQWVTNAYGQ